MTAPVTTADAAEVPGQGNPDGPNQASVYAGPTADPLVSLRTVIVLAADETPVIGARRVDHANATDYGFGAPGIEYLLLTTGGMLIPDVAGLTQSDVLYDDVAGGPGASDPINPSSLTITTRPAHGAAAVFQGCLYLAPVAGYAGADVLFYTVANDAAEASAATLVAITVLAAAGKLIAPITVSARRGATLTIDPATAFVDTDEGINIQAVEVTSPATHGTATVVGRVVEYVASESYVGTDTFRWRTLVDGVWCPPGVPEPPPPPPPGPLPFVQRSTAMLRAVPRKVFAHWHFFPISVDNDPPASDYYQDEWLTPSGEGGLHLLYGGFIRHRPLGRAPLPGDFEQTDCETDVRHAIAVGIDGFFYNILTTNPADATWTRFISMLDAAEAVDPGFLLVPNIDASVTPQAGRAAMTALLATIIDRPAIYRIDGEPVVAAYAAEFWDLASWQAAITDLGCKLVQIHLTYGVGSTPATTYGQGIWGNRSAPTIASGASAATTHAAGRIWVEPVCPQDMRPADQAYWEANGSLLLRTMFAEAAATTAEWIQLVTWNDYRESSVWQPSTGGQNAYHDLLAYYIETFKIAAPTIVRDVLYYFHRIEPTTVTYDTILQPEPFLLFDATPASNTIECLAFLTAPGTLEIEVDGGTTQQAAAAGVTSFAVPLGTGGMPIFRLIRSAVTVIEVTSAFTLRTSVTYQDFVYRAGGSSRAVVPLVANP